MAIELTVVPSVRPGVRRGAVYGAAPVFWIPEDMEIVRPPGSRDWTEIRAEEWPRVRDRFRVGDHVERVLVNAKLRPVIVVSHDRELQGRAPARVVPLHSYNPGSWAERMRVVVEAGGVAHALHVRAGHGLHEGYANLREATLVPRIFFDHTEHLGDLDALSLATLLRHYATYIAA